MGEAPALSPAHVEAARGGSGPGRPRRAHPYPYLDEEAVADVADLHSIGVRLPDVLLHLQDGPAVQSELPFFLQGHNAWRLSSARGLAPSAVPQPRAQEDKRSGCSWPLWIFTNPSQPMSVMPP